MNEKIINLCDLKYNKYITTTYKYFFVLQYEYDNSVNPIVCHKIDGAAVEDFKGKKEYYLLGIEYSEENYWNHSDVIRHKYLQEHPELEGFL